MPEERLSRDLPELRNAPLVQEGKRAVCGETTVNADYS